MRTLQITFLVFLVPGLCWAAPSSIVISGNESKIDLRSGSPRGILEAGPDTVTILDFAEFPPRLQHISDVPNTVIGPPSNIAISPDGTLALVANSIRLDPADPDRFNPESTIHVMDLGVSPPKVVGRVQAGLQPSGMSIAPDGTWALVANRADGTVSVLRIAGRQVELADTIPVCLPEESVSDVAIHPSGAYALASVQKGGYLSLLEIAGGRARGAGRKFSVYGQPYRVVMTPDGTLGLTAGQGAGNGPDLDAVSIVDLEADPPRTIDYVPVGSVPESIEVSPDGRWLAAVVMNGSNLAPDSPNYRPNGGVVLLARRGKTYAKVQELPVGRIPEGVAFTRDGRHLVVQCHPDRQIWVFRVGAGGLEDTGLRLSVPGMPSSLRAAP